MIGRNTKHCLGYFYKNIAKNVSQSGDILIFSNRTSHINFRLLGMLNIIWAILYDNIAKNVSQSGDIIIFQIALVK